MVVLFDTLEEETCDHKLFSKFQVYLVSSKSLEGHQDGNNPYIQQRRMRKAEEASHHMSPFPSCHSGLLSGDFPDTRAGFYSRIVSGLKIELECNG